MKPEVNLNVPWGICGYSNADYAGYKYNNNMTGYAVLFNGLVITWHSQSQNISTLFVIEAEYSEIMEVCCKILSIRNILLFMGVVVEYPITVHVDDVGAIFLSDNTSVSQWTKHIGVYHHFISD